MCFSTFGIMTIDSWLTDYWENEYVIASKLSRVTHCSCITAETTCKICYLDTL